MIVDYLTHDVWNENSVRRVQMLHAGGAIVRVAGFRRREPSRAEIDGAVVQDLGRAYDAALWRRALQLLFTALRAPAWAPRLNGGDVLVARSLELLVLAVVARVWLPRKPRLVYEILDIHRSLVGHGFASRAMRWLERRLMARCELLIVSSPGFILSYFGPIQRTALPSLVVENKFVPRGTMVQTPMRPPAGSPWRIGWFGVIRCAHSLKVLINLTKRFPGQVEVVIAGRIAETEFDDFEATVAASAGVRFLGAYAYEELADLYSQCHFAWAIDFFEAEANSQWLLPNRIYEGGAFDVVSIAMADVETGRWLAERGLGVRLEGDLEPAINQFFETLTPERYEELAAAAQAAPADWFVTSDADTTALMHALETVSEKAA